MGASTRDGSTSRPASSSPPAKGCPISSSTPSPMVATRSRGQAPRVHLTTLTEYRSGWPYPVAFPPRVPEVTLAQTIAEHGDRQLHVAETEKYAHVTYFFNGGREEEWEGEARCLVPSARDVPTYDHKPEMSAAEAADAFRERWTGDGYRFGIINF